MTLSALAVFAVTLLVTAGTPGPSVAALVARVLTNGVRDVLPFLAAMWVGEALGSRSRSRGCPRSRARSKRA